MRNKEGYMLSMRSFLVSLVVGTVLIASGITVDAGTITWGYTADLGGSYSEGWLVELWEDVDKDNTGGSWYDSVSIWNDHTSGGDDIFREPNTAALVSGKGGVYWGDSFSFGTGGDLKTNDWVFSVIYNAATFAGATQYQVVDTTPYALPINDIDADYRIGSVAGQWHNIIPEPGTLTLLGLGLLTVGIRRRFFK